MYLEIEMTIYTSAKNSTGLNLLDELIKALNPKADELGLMISFWNQHGIIAGPRSCNNFLEILYNVHSQEIMRQRESIVEKVRQSHQAVREINTLDCCMIGIPVFDRRKQIGTIVIEYPPIEITEEEALHRLCHKAQLDKILTEKLADNACRYRKCEAEHLQIIFNDLMLEQIYTIEASQAVVSLSSNLATTYEELALMYRISSSMTVSMEPIAFLKDIGQQIRDVMGVENVAAIITDSSMRLGDNKIVQVGNNKISDVQLSLLNSEFIASKLTDKHKTIIENNFAKQTPHNLGINIKHFIATPLLSNDNVVGMLIGINKVENDFDSSDIKLIRSVAGQTSVFLSNHKMYAELQELLMGVLYSLTESIDAKDPYTCGHSRRVANMSRRLAQEIGLSPERVHQIYLSGLLHDVGKIGIPEGILCKQGKLTDEEYENMKRHPAIGAKILRRIRHLQPILAGVLSHHERLDGRGYPQQLKGKEIPIEGRIICIADSWDAMTSHRTYRRALDFEKARSELIRCKGTQFDPELVDIFLSWDIDDMMEELHDKHPVDQNLIDDPI